MEHSIAVTFKDGTLYTNEGEKLLSIKEDYRVPDLSAVPYLEIAGLIEEDLISDHFPKPIKIKFHEPTTVVWWDDGTKTYVVAQEGDKFDKEKGIAMCYMKKAHDNKGNYNDTLNKFIQPDFHEYRKQVRKAKKQRRHIIEE